MMNSEVNLDYMKKVESKANAYLSSVTQDELMRKVEKKQRNGSTISLTVEDMLIELFQEETHHRGELIALLWQIDVNPPHLGWSRYIHSRVP